jgi:hypothetical protein
MTVQIFVPCVNQAAESLPQPQGGAAPVVQDTPAPQGLTDPLPNDFQSTAHFLEYVTSHANCENMYQTN